MALTGTGAIPLDTSRASLQIVICQIVTRSGGLERYLDPVVANL